MEPVSATYHVFINHRGPDVKKTLASLIYHRLTTCHGLRVFLDQKELHTGDGLSPAIRGAIESASVHVAIFSERYAESRWCLDELCWILRCNRKIIPVFCDVEPKDLSYIDSEKGRYKKAFEEHQRKGRVTMEDIQKWKKALGTAALISGVPFKTDESDHGEVVEKIVKDVLEGVKWEPLEVPKYLVGLDPAVKEITDEIKQQWELNGTAIVGIAGMAGVGKSTLAAHLYNMKRSDFSRSCFLSEVRKKDLTSLQRKLLRDLLGCDFDIEDTRQGKGIFRDRLRGLQVLIVLDDADHIEQINSLLVTDVLGSRSLILITSRDQDLLTRFSQKTVVYKVKQLQGTYARELFRRHAFHQSQPYEGFEHLVEEALKICGGLPLTLQVLGGQFFGRHEKQFWEQKLEMFPRNPPRDIINTLTVSYEALSREEQEIFLDIGCFFVGEEKEVAVGVIKGLGYNYNDICACLENLRHKCLVEYHDEAQCDYENKSRSEEPSKNLSLCDSDSNGNYDYLDLPKRNKITMHDQIRHLARRIAREEFGVLPKPKPARLSCSSDIEELMLKLQGGADSCLIRGIRTPKGQNPPDCTNYIKGMGVRLFMVEVPIDLSSPFRLWDMSGDLVWLRLRSFTSIYFPDTISLTNIRVLEVEGNGDFEQLFQRFNKPPRNLNVLNIDVTPPRNLNVLNIDVTDTDPRAILNPSKHARRMPQSVTNVVHPSTSSRSRSLDSAQEDFMASSFFRFLKWIGTSIKRPWKNVLKNIPPRNLNVLNIDVTDTDPRAILNPPKHARRMPQSVTNVVHLSTSSRSRSLDGAQKDFTASSFFRFLKWIGTSIKSPWKIVLKNITFLESLPVDFLELKSLTHLDLSGCTDLTHLPNSFSELMHLQFLALRDCNKLSFPMNILGNMSSLEYADFKGCSKLKCWPTGIANQRSLKYLNVLATHLKLPITLKLPDSLEQLRIGNTLDTSMDFHLNEMSEFVYGSPLRRLRLQQQNMFVGPLDATEPLDAMGTLGGIPNLEPLELPSRIRLHGIANLEEPVLDTLTGFQVYEDSMSVHKVAMEKEEKNFGPLDATEPLDAMVTEGVPLSNAFGSTSGSVGIEVQTHMSGSQLRPLGDLRRLEDLKELILIGLDGLKRILWEEIAGPNIKLLVIASCPIDNISFKNPGTMRVDMSVLRDLTLSRTLITEICFPEGVFPSLETLDLSGNRKLMQVKGLQSTLVTLNLQGCSQLTEVEDLPSTLVSLNLQGCRELKRLNLSNLVDLKFLSVNHCYSLETLNVEGLTSLEEIQAESCFELQNIQGLTQLERLKCLRILTNTDVIWNDICNFLTSTFREKLSTAFFSGIVGKPSTDTSDFEDCVQDFEDTSYFEMAMQKTYSIAGEFNLKVVDVKVAVDVGYPVLQSSFHTKMEEFQSYGAILMCFLVTPVPMGSHFRVRFEASNDGGSADEYEIHEGMSFGFEAKLHVFMWAEECDMFRDCKGYNNIYVTCNLSPHQVKRGWIMMVDKDTDVSQVCTQIIPSILTDDSFK